MRFHLAQVRLRQGRPDETEALARADLRGPKGFAYIRCLRLLADVLLRRGDGVALRQLPWSELISLSGGILANAGAHLPEREHLDLVASQRGVIDVYFSFLALGEAGQPINAFAISNRKGSVLVEQSRRRTERAHPTLAPLFERRDALGRELASRPAPAGRPRPTRRCRPWCRSAPPWRCRLPACAAPPTCRSF